MSSDADKRVDDAMLMEEDRQQQQSPDNAPSTNSYVEKILPKEL